MKLPLKTRILEYAIGKRNNITLEDILSDLANEYKGERIFNKKIIEGYILSFVGVKILETSKIEFDKNRNLVVSYDVTEFGFSREKYIPGHENPKSGKTCKIAQ